MKRDKAINVRNALYTIISIFGKDEYGVAINNRNDGEWEVHIFSRIEVGLDMNSAGQLMNALKEFLGLHASLKSFYNAGTTEPDLRNSFKIW